MIKETKYMIFDKNTNSYYMEFDGFKNIPRFTRTIHHSWIFYSEDDAKSMIKHIISQLYEDKKDKYDLDTARIELIAYIERTD